MRNINQSLSLLTLALLTLSCQPSNEPNTTSKKHIHTPLFLYFDFASHIVGDLSEVSLIVPPGISLHDYEPTPRDMLHLQNSDLLIFTSNAMVPWVSRLLSDKKTAPRSVLNITQALSMEEHDHDEHHAHEDAHHDPHIWMSPALILPIFDVITKSIIEMDPENEPAYTINAGAYRQQLEESLLSMVATIQASKRKPLLFAGGFSHVLFLTYHNLDWFTVYASDHMENEPSIRRMAEAKAFIYDHQLTSLFVDPIFTTKIAETLAQEFSLDLLPFHTAHSITKEQLTAGTTYIQLMEENRINLEKALNHKAS